MQNIVDWINYVSKVIEAISEGIKVTLARWPADVPGSKSKDEKPV